MLKASLALLVVSIAGSASAETLRFSAALSGAGETPPNASAAKGELVAELDTGAKTLAYQATYQGLSGPAVAAHFHGPAAPGANAGVAVPVAKLDSPIAGQAVLTDAQIADLEGGRWYFNVHTQAHPGGEIRGQLAPSK